MAKLSNCKYLRLLRIKDWFYIIGLAFLGFFYKERIFKFIDIFLLIIVSSLYLAHGYSLNEYFDLRYEYLRVSKEDRKHTTTNRKPSFLPIFLLFLNCIISFYLSKLIFFLIVLGGLCSYLYSSSFTRLKNRPLANILLNSSGFTILFIIGYLFNKPLSIMTFYLSGFIWLGVIPSQIIHLMAHNQIERNWPFPLVVSYKLFYLSLLIWAGWSFLVFSITNNMHTVSLATLTFCAIQFLIIRSFNKSDLSNGRIVAIRDKFKIINIIFGAILLILLLGF